jgi:uncharacterized protein with PIN domain
MACTISNCLFRVVEYSWIEVNFGTKMKCPDCGARLSKQTQYETTDEFEEGDDDEFFIFVCESCGWAEDEDATWVAD